MDQICETCRYWLKITTEGVGFCRRFPPIKTIKDERVSRFPRTTRLAWCGEWDNDGT